MVSTLALRPWPAHRENAVFGAVNRAQWRPLGRETERVSSAIAARRFIGRSDELGRLDIDQRSVIALHYYLDLPMREVAEILDIPFGTAASRLHRGLENLRTNMRGHPAADYPLATERSS